MGKGKINSGVGVGERLLAWYDRSRRTLPWRAAPGQKPDPYAVWLSEVMLQQTTVAAVGAFYAKFLTLWPRVENLAAAPVEAVMQAWAGLGYYSRARNLHACAQSIVRDHGGRFPDSEADLLRLPGVGAYTAAAIAAIAFDIPAIVVDGNVERVIARLRAVETPLPAAKKEISALVAEIAPRARPGDFAQAMMDLGATICTPRNPACVLCPLRSDCAASAAGTQEDYPRKATKKPRPLRRGAVFYLRRADGAVLTRTRPPRGLLGGMEEFFGTDWRSERTADWAALPPAGDDARPPARADWRHAGEIEHVFTHFALKLAVFVAEAPHGAAAPEGGRWQYEPQMRAAALPSVMRKAERAALGFLAVSGLSGEKIGS